MNNLLVSHIYSHTHAHTHTHTYTVINTLTKNNDLRNCKSSKQDPCLYNLLNNNKLSKPNIFFALTETTNCYQRNKLRQVKMEQHLQRFVILHFILTTACREYNVCVYSRHNYG